MHNQKSNKNWVYIFTVFSFFGFFFIKLIHNYINHVKLWCVVCLGSILHSNTSLFLYSNIPILWQIESILVDLEFWKGLFKFVLKIAWFLSNTVLSQYYVTLACIYSDICLLCWFFNYFKSFFFFLNYCCYSSWSVCSEYYS